MTLEAVLLTGGKSTRMGVDKASLLVDGEPSATRIQRLLGEKGIPVTVLGPGGIPDQYPDGGPVLALFSYMPTFSNTFVCSCDLPAYDPAIPHFLESKLEDFHAAIPEFDGKLQYLCGSYSREAFLALHDAVQQGDRSMKLWVQELRIRKVTREELAEAGINPLACMGANTPEEWTARIESARKPFLRVGEESVGDGG